MTRKYRPKVPVDKSTGCGYLVDMNTNTPTPTTHLHPAIVAGSRVRRNFDLREGVVTRVLDTSGARSGLIEVRWDGQRKPSRSAGFELGDEVTPA